MTQDRYTHGHQESVVAAHATRSIADSAAYMQTHLQPGIRLLDVGCGPGSITAEFADRVGSRGHVLGIDYGPEVVQRATQNFADSGAEFAVMDTYALELEDDGFDVVHAHQVLQHLSDPVAALREMRRVARPGGVIAVRDADYAGMHWSPASPMLDEWLRIYRSVARANRAEPDAGRHLLDWAHRAGLDRVEPSADVWLYATPERRGWWASMWADRTVTSSFGAQAIELGLASPSDLEAIADGWRTWAQEPSGWFVVPHGELVCQV